MTNLREIIIRDFVGNKQRVDFVVSEIEFDCEERDTDGSRSRGCVSTEFTGGSGD